MELRHQPFSTLRIVDLMVREGVAAAIAVYLRLYEWSLIEVLALLLLLIDPKVGKHLGNLVGHEPRKDGVAGILRSRGQYAIV